MNIFKKMISITVISSIYLSFFCTFVDASNITIEPVTEEIIKIESNYNREIVNKTKTNKYINNNGTFYNEYLIRYDEDFTIIDKEAFKLAEFKYDTSNCPYDYKNLSLLYKGGGLLEWYIDDEICNSDIIWDLLKQKINFDISKTSPLSTICSTTVNYKIKKDSLAVIPVYAYGYKTSGNLVYKWTDRRGNFGYNYKHIEAYLPYKKTNKIKFGRVYYKLN